MATKSIINYKNDLLKMPSHLQWDEIAIGEIYHLPPIISLPRKDICITKKDTAENMVYYYVIGDAAKSEFKFASTSILARFIIKKHNF